MLFSSFQLQKRQINKTVLCELYILARLIWLSRKLSGRDTVMSYQDQAESNWNSAVREMCHQGYDMIYDQGDIRSGISDLTPNGKHKEDVVY